MKIYLRLIKVFIISLGISLLLSSCGNSPAFLIPSQDQLQKERLIREISEKIASQKSFVTPMIQGFKVFIQTNGLEEPASGFMENNLEQIQTFYDNPEKSLEKIAGGDHGLEKLELLEAVYAETDPATVSEKMAQVDPDMGSEFEQRINQATTQSLPVSRLLTYGNFNQITLQTNSSSLPFTSKTVNIYSGICLTALAGEVLCKHAQAPWLKVAGAATALASYLAMAYNLYLWQETFSALVTTETDENGDLVKTSALYPPISNYIYQVAASTAIPLGYGLKALPAEMPVIQAALNTWAAKVGVLPFVRFIQYGIIEIPLGGAVVNFVVTPSYVGFKIKY